MQTIKTLLSTTARRYLTSLLCAMLLAGALPISAQTAERDKVSVRLKWLAQAQFAGFYVAQEKGFYRNNQLEVTINPGGPNINVETLVASGADTFGLAGGMESVLTAREKGLPVVALAMSQQRTPFVFVTYDDSGIHSFKDFKGKKVSVWFTGVQYPLLASLGQVGLSKNDITLIPQSVSLNPFIDKQVDVATVTLYNEYNTLKEKGVTNLRLISPDDVGVTTQQDALITSKAVIEKDPALVQRFVNATLEGWQYALTHRAETLDILMKANPGLNRPHQQAMLDSVAQLMYPEGSPGLGSVNLEQAEKMMNLLVKYGALKQPVDINQTFDLSFWQNVPAGYKTLN
ncbi:ABC transporter substrate-binding protein [Affinibrenneria salicis]|uniref:Thiamine pyrimidine synthase n=1 Tax=Affinibrenneria salicis TaxID=2590031 RepID=A0A5J5FR09_9GAMM|nr:ABC transporter substrate-binding protein [Affinibrenneria salicis]KAA8994993.1 ABC transporter substrate-binding protein [Affinibrenneria salicis]